MTVPRGAGPVVVVQRVCGAGMGLLKVTCRGRPHDGTKWGGARGSGARRVRCEVLGALIATMTPKGSAGARFTAAAADGRSQACGFGNWADVTRRLPLNTADECAHHYEATCVHWSGVGD